MVAIMKIIKEPPAAALEAAQAALHRVEQVIGDLRVQRSSAIENGADDFARRAAVCDAEIATQTAAAAALRERIDLIERHKAEAAQQQREQAKKAAVAEISKHVVARQSAAERLDTVLKQLLQALEAFDAAEQAVFADWPDVLPPAHRFSYLRLHLDALSTARKPRMGAGLIRELASHVPYGLATMTAERNTELVAELEAAPVPVLETEEAA